MTDVPGAAAAGEMREVLEWYADKENHRARGKVCSPVFADDGTKARAALASAAPAAPRPKASERVGIGPADILRANAVDEGYAQGVEDAAKRALDYVSARARPTVDGLRLEIATAIRALSAPRRKA